VTDYTQRTAIKIT